MSGFKTWQRELIVYAAITIVCGAIGQFAGLVFSIIHDDPRPAVTLRLICPNGEVKVFHDPKGPVSC